MSHQQEFTKKLRLVELDLVRSLFPENSALLEVGAGAGWQARSLAEDGHEVKAIDYANLGFASLRKAAVFPIEDYDGVNIPFPDESFDVVFSSNVLEHVQDEDGLQSDIFRVLKPEGIAVHVMPTTAWRIWSWITHYMFAAKKLVGKFSCRKRNVNAVPDEGGKTTGQRAGRSFAQKLYYYAIPERHGEIGNVLTEAWHFSTARWHKTFARANFTVEFTKCTGVFYTGYGVFGPELSLETRSRLSKFLGSATMIYVVRKRNK